MAKKSRGSSGRVETKKNLPPAWKKYEDETPKKDYDDYRKEFSPEKDARAKKEALDFSNADLNNLTIWEATLKNMELTKPANRKQPDWDIKHASILQIVNGLRKLSKTVK